MKTVAIVSQKGGVGKTTAAIEVGFAAHLAGLAAAIIDSLLPRSKPFMQLKVLSAKTGVTVQELSLEALKSRAETLSVFLGAIFMWRRVRLR